VRLRRVSLTGWIFLGMATGILVGWLAPGFAVELRPLSTVFLRMIKSVVVPIIFGTLVIGIAGHGDDLKRIGRLALKSIGYFWIMTTVALAVGLLAGNLVRPGAGVVLPPPDPNAPIPTAAPTTFGGFLEHIVPRSVVEAAANGEVLQVVFWATLFALALTQVKGRPKEMMLGFAEGLMEVMFKFVGLVMKFAPIGIGAAVAVTVGRSGLGVLANLGALVLTLYGALVVFALLVLFPIAFAFKVPIHRFCRAVKEPWLLAFSTASSEAAFPLALRNMERLGVPRRIVSFVLPTGYSFNMDGTALYLAIASVFVAQAAGIDMPLSQQILMMVSLMLTSKGVAAVPRASLVILAGTLAQFGLPLQGVAVILGVDALMDMARTSLNVVGNCLATVLLARWEGAFTLSRDDVPTQLSPELRGAPT